MRLFRNKGAEVHGSSEPAAKDPKGLSVEAQLDQHVAGIAKVLNQCLGFLDELGMSQAATHLSAAINALPGQIALPPIELLDLIADGLPAFPSRPERTISAGSDLPKTPGPR